MSAVPKGRWVRVTKSKPCQHCGESDHQCKVSEDGLASICWRVGGPGSVAKTDKRGTTFYFYGTVPDSDTWEMPAKDSPPVEAIRRGEPDTLHKVYSAFLSRLTLSGGHADDLDRRGFHAGEGERLGYRTMPRRFDRGILDELVKEFGVPALLTVPGFFKDRALAFGAMPGLIVPVRDVGARIIGLVVRLDKPIDGGAKLLWVSSSKRNGPSPGSPVHVPLQVKAPAHRLRITEGQIKADLAWLRSGLPTIGVAGVAGWRSGLDAALALQAKTAVLAFDADFRRKPKDVGTPLASLAREAHAAGLAVELELWEESEAKGIDDLLADGKSPRVVIGDDVWTELRRFVPDAGPSGETIGGDAPNEAEDDPHRLARIYRDQRCLEGGVLRVRYWNGGYLGHSGGRYRDLPAEELKADLGTKIKEEFDRLNVEAIARWRQAGDDKPKPLARKVTQTLKVNTAGNLASLTLVPTGDVKGSPSVRSMPAWLDGPGPWPAEEVLPAVNGLFHLPSLVENRTPFSIPPTPRYFSTFALDYPVSLDAPPPVNWLTFLGTMPIGPHSRVKLQLWPDDVQTIQALQEWIGLQLVPDTSFQKMAALIGPRRAGKGVIARIVRALIGPDNVAGPTLSGLATNFGLQPLIGKHTAIIDDARLSGRTDAAVIVERLLTVTGEGTLTIDRKHQTAWTGKLSARFTILSNELPRLMDSSGALAGRFLIFPFTKSFYGQEDRGLTELLMGELPGILLWAIEGWRRLRERGHFVQPDSGKALIERLEELASPIGAFLRDECEIGPGLDVECKALFEQWVDWCKQQNRDHPGTVQTFGRDLQAAVPQLRVARPREGEIRVRKYEGIRIKEDPR